MRFGAFPPEGAESSALLQEPRRDRATARRGRATRGRPPRRQVWTRSVFAVASRQKRAPRAAPKRAREARVGGGVAAQTCGHRILRLQSCHCRLHSGTEDGGRRLCRGTLDGRSSRWLWAEARQRAPLEEERGGGGAAVPQFRLLMPAPLNSEMFDDISACVDSTWRESAVCPSDNACKRTLSLSLCASCLPLLADASHFIPGLLELSLDRLGQGNYRLNGLPPDPLNMGIHQAHELPAELLQIQRPRDLRHLCGIHHPQG